MTGRLLWRFLLDRSGTVIAVYLNTFLVVATLAMVLSARTSFDTVIGELWYALLLSTVLLALYLGVDLARWWPFARQVERLLAGSPSPEALASLPPGGNLDQAAAARLVARLDTEWAAERLRQYEAHSRHKAFTNLWVHQMKTPIAAISLLAQDSAGKPAEELRSVVSAVEDEAQKVADGLELVLNMARVEEFAVDYHIRRVNLLESVRQVVNSRKRQFIRHSIFPEVVADGDSWFVLTDEKWNRFIIDQVVANALKYASQSGRESQRLTLELLRQERSVLLRIADEGPGIPRADLPRIFEPFFTGVNGRRFGGATGIGLYLVRQVADRLGHGIEVVSEEGQGTAVSLVYSLATLQN